MTRGYDEHPSGRLRPLTPKGLTGVWRALKSPGWSKQASENTTTITLVPLMLGTEVTAPPAAAPPAPSTAEGRAQVAGTGYCRAERARALRVSGANERS